MLQGVLNIFNIAWTGVQNFLKSFTIDNTNLFYVLLAALLLTFLVHAFIRFGKDAS